MSTIKRHMICNQRGAFIVIFALVLLVLLGFVALGIEGGRWFLVRAELAKGVDAAALAGARNISNPFLSPGTAATLAEEYGRENFPAGYVGTPSGGSGAVRFTAVQSGSDKVSVTGNVNATVVLAQLFGITSIPVTATSVAQKRDSEIMMILDRSGSMQGLKMTSLQAAAISFLSNFQSTQAQDKVGLISFAGTIKYEWDLGNNFYNSTNIAKINNMSASGGTNMGDAFDAADGWTDSTGTVYVGFTNQAGIPGDQRVQQFVVFFSDGQPTCFSGRFRHQGRDFDAVACSTDNCRSFQTDALWHNLNATCPGCECDQTHPQYCLGNDMPTPTGTGQTTQCCSGGVCTSNTTRWYIFGTRPVPGYAAQYCNIPSSLFNGYNGYMCSTARDLTTQQANALKANGVLIYVIGLGSNQDIDVAYLQSLSSGSSFTYIAPTTAQLQGIFNAVAKDIKLRLVM